MWGGTPTSTFLAAWLDARSVPAREGGHPCHPCHPCVMLMLSTRRRTGDGAHAVETRRGAWQSLCVKGEGPFSSFCRARESPSARVCSLVGAGEIVVDPIPLERARGSSGASGLRNGHCPSMPCFRCGEFRSSGELPGGESLARRSRRIWCARGFGDNFNNRQQRSSRPTSFPPFALAVKDPLPALGHKAFAARSYIIATPPRS